MNCPACKDTVLTMADRQGVEIDYCPKCRGVWLDRGELDKILERSDRSAMGESSAGPSQQTPPQQPAHNPYPQQPPPVYQGPRKMDDSDYYGYEYRGPGHHPKYKKRKSILREIFDF